LILTACETSCADQVEGYTIFDLNLKMFKKVQVSIGLFEEIYHLQPENKKEEEG